MLVQEEIQVQPGHEDKVSVADSTCQLAERLRALADATRLQIIYLLMARGEMCVCEFMSLLDLTQSNVSFHLKTLKHAGFVSSRKEGKWMHYSLNREAIGQFRTDLDGALDISKRPEKIEPASCEDTVCGQKKCR